MATEVTPDTKPPVSEDPVGAAKAAASEQIASKPARRWRARAFQAYLVAATAAFTVLVVLASTTNYFPIDLTVTLAVQRITAAWFVTLMEFVSYFGYTPQMYVLVAAVVIFLAALGLRWEAVATLLVAALSSGFGQVVKIVVHRPRPGANLVNVVQQLNSYSFPSGHVLTYTAFFGFLFFLVYSLLKPSAVRTVLLALLAAPIALVGISRIYLGDHWASDALGAYLLGSLALVAGVYIYQWGKTRFFVRQPLAPEKATPGNPKP